MKQLFLLFLLACAHTAGYACSACEKQQPKMLKGITHGTGPQSNWDYVIIWSIAIIVLITLFYSLKFLISPGEKSADHIKRLMLKKDNNGLQ